MSTPDRIQLAVETPSPGFRLIRVAGSLETGAAARLARLAELQLQVLAVLGPAGYRRAHLLVDLAGVNHFGPGCLEMLRHVRHTGSRAGVGLHLTGCAGRLALLPVQVRDLFTEFSTFPTVEVAVAGLAVAGLAVAELAVPGPRTVELGVRGDEVGSGLG